MRDIVLRLIILSFFLFLPDMTAKAQPLPAPADAGRALERLQEQNPARAQRPLSRPALHLPGMTMPDNAAEMTFTLQDVTLTHSTVYTAADIDATIAPLRGKNISLQQVYALAQTLTAQYRRDGYILSQVIVPPQTIENGALTLRAIEGFIGTISFQDTPAPEKARLEKYTAPLKTARPLKAAQLERALLLMNDLPGLVVESVLSPSTTTQGAADLTLVISRKNHDAFFDIHNRGSRYLGALQAQTAVRLNNPLGFDEAVTFQLATAPDGFPHRELDFAAIGVEKPLGSHGTVWEIGGSITSTDPGHDLATSDIKGLARAFYTGIRHPVIRTRQQNLFVNLSFHMLDSERTDNLGLGKTEDRLRVLRLSGDWEYTDQLQGANRAQITASKGLDVLNMKRKNSPNPTRARGDPEFFKIGFDASRIQRLGHHLELALSSSGQKSAHYLLASEEFGIGGTRFGSAYDSSEITGEDGLAARVELRTGIMGYTSSLRPYIFYDIGKVWDRDSLAARDRQRSLASTGLGARFSFGHNFSGDIEAALPLTRRVEANNDNDLRLFGRLTARF